MFALFNKLLCLFAAFLAKYEGRCGSKFCTVLESNVQTDSFQLHSDWFLQKFLIAVLKTSQSFLMSHLAS